MSQDRECNHDHEGPCRAMETTFVSLPQGEAEIVQLTLGFGGPAIALDFEPDSTQELLKFRIRAGGIASTGQDLEAARELLQMGLDAVDRFLAQKAAEVTE